MKSLYMAAIPIPPPLSDEIRQMQKVFSMHYGSAAALKPPVHVTVSPPIHLDGMALEKFGDNLKESASAVNPFVMNLKDFGFFIRNKVLFIRVEPNEHLIRLVNQFHQKQGIGQERDYQSHITIGYRNISPEMFKRIQAEYQQKPFCATAEVSHIELWKHEQGLWRTIKTFPLGKFFG